MNKTQTFEKLDKLANGLRDISELPDPERKKTPEYKKWRTAINTLPKEEKKEYYTRAYEASRQERMNEDGDNIIKPDTRIIFFWLGKKVVKEEKLLNEKESISRRIADAKKDEQVAQNIGVPDLVDIDYSEIKDIPVAKHGGFLKPYKDGFLIVRDDNPKNYHYFDISNYVDVPQAEGKMIFHTACFNQDVHYYLRADHIKKMKPYKNNLNFYFVFKKAYKNKAYKISFKNNKYVTHIFDLFDRPSIDSPIEKQCIDIVAHLPSDFLLNYIESNGVFELYEEQADIEKLGEAYEQKTKQLLSITKEKLLKSGYYFSIMAKFLHIIPMISSVLKNVTKEDDETLQKTVMKYFKEIDPKDFVAITKKALEVTTTGEWSKKDLLGAMQQNIIGMRKIQQEGTFDMLELSDKIFNLAISYQSTEKGTSLPVTGKINVENATNIDCCQYWNYITTFNLVNGCLDIQDFPLLLDKGKVINEQRLEDHIQTIKIATGAKPFRYPFESFELESATKSTISEILKEAMEQTTGLLIPYNACVGLKDDPIFKYIRFIEYEKYIAIFAHDQNDRFISEMYVKGEAEFRYWLYNSDQILDSEVKKSSQHMYLKLAACIRDWKILIERDSTMSYQGCRIPTGVKSSKPRQMYLPRVSSKRSTGKEQKRREKIFFNENRKFSGERRAHRRKLQSGMKASKFQMLLASDANIYVPDGYTFVRKTDWGKIKKSKREIRYRTTSLNGLFYASDHEIQKVKNINELSPAGFEEKMEDYVDKKGWKVTKRNNYDGGIDIRAIKEFKDGTIKKLLAQCKHPAISKKPIGPNVIRELIGAAELEESKHEKVLMVITSSVFTIGARKAAKEKNIELVDGDDLIK